MIALHRFRRGPGEAAGAPRFAQTVGPCPRGEWDEPWVTDRVDPLELEPDTDPAAE